MHWKGLGTLLEENIPVDRQDGAGGAFSFGELLPFFDEKVRKALLTLSFTFSSIEFIDFV